MGRQRDRRDAVALGVLQSVRVDDESSASSEPWVGVGADGLIVEGRLTALGLTGDEDRIQRRDGRDYPDEARKG